MLHGVGSFDRAEFSDATELDRMICYGNLSLDRTSFAGPVTLKDTQCFGGLWGNQTMFASRVDLRGLEVHGRTWLVGAALADERARAGEGSVLRAIRSYGYRWV